MKGNDTRHLFTSLLSCLLLLGCVDEEPTIHEKIIGVWEIKESFTPEYGVYDDPANIQLTFNQNGDYGFWDLDLGSGGTGAWEDIIINESSSCEYWLQETDNSGVTILVIENFQMDSSLIFGCQIQNDTLRLYNYYPWTNYGSNWVRH